MAEKHLIVVSVDAMVYEDLEILKTLPNTGALLQKGSLVQKMTTVYPSLTHPVHASLMSGNPAGKTGIFNNTVFAPGIRNPEWNNQLEQMQCDTLFHAAHRSGLKTAACRWPMTAGGFSEIDYLVPEVLDHETEGKSLEEVYEKACSPVLYESIVKPRLFQMEGKERHPAYEEFSMECAAEIIRQYRPNLLMTHPGLVDHCRHLTGLFSETVTESLKITDRWIGILMDAVRDAGIEDSTDFAVISDHGHMEFVRSVALNVLFAEKGWLTVRENGTPDRWEVLAVSAGLSCQIYVRDPEKEPEVEQTLRELADTGLYGFTEVLNTEECETRYGLSGDFCFVLEGDGYTGFSSDLTGALIRTNGDAGCGNHRSSHGHMPEKGPQPPMIVAGPSFRSGIRLERSSILNEAPTFAAVLGCSLRETQGCAITELLK